MRQTLRRSCDACAKSKHSCDLATPQCSRCAKRHVKCVYANEPLTTTMAVGAAVVVAPMSISTRRQQKDTSNRAYNKLPQQKPPLSILVNYTFGSVDPFDSYPHTRLPRADVQRLIHSFLRKIAFQYYPLDLSATSNPFLVSWWPLALGDATLFHVSLQTACLDEELLARKGFQKSDILMTDSVSLLIRKVQDVSLAVQDGTINSVITLAAIEFGKGNLEVSKIHIRGVKQLVKLRGGIGAVRQTSPLTGRMISWVSMLVTGHPQFKTQNNSGRGSGIPVIPEWLLERPPTTNVGLCDAIREDIDDAVWDVFMRLRNIFTLSWGKSFDNTRLHDLACFTIHRLLPSAAELAQASSSSSSPMTECLRYSIILYMFVMQGPTYYSHDVIVDTILSRLRTHMDLIWAAEHVYNMFDVWFLAVAMVASVGTRHYIGFVEKAGIVACILEVNSEDIQKHMRGVLWLDKEDAETRFAWHWVELTTTQKDGALMGMTSSHDGLPIREMYKYE